MFTTLSWKTSGIFSIILVKNEGPRNLTMTNSLLKPSFHIDFKEVHNKSQGQGLNCL